MKDIKHIDYIAADNKFVATRDDGSKFEPSQQQLDECAELSKARLEKFIRNE